MSSASGTRLSGTSDFVCVCCGSCGVQFSRALNVPGTEVCLVLVV